jgi:putative ABC transport system permease protein
MESIWQDFSYGARALVKRPAVTTVIVLALTLAIGANTAIFSAINAVLLRRLPYEHADRLVMVWEANMKKGWGLALTSPLNFQDIKEQSTMIEELVVFNDNDFSLTGYNNEPERVKGIRASANLFSLLGVKPAYGRAFALDEDKTAGAARVVIISWGLWQRRFGANENIVGQNLRVDDENYTVIGIMPEKFYFPPPFSANLGPARLTMKNADLWIPLTTDDVPNVRELRTLFVVGRLAQGRTIEQAKSEMSSIAQRLEKNFPGPNTGLEIKVIPLQEQVVGEISRPLLILFAAVGFTLLIACANITNLLLANAAARRREMAIRQALGATRHRLIRQLLTESILISLLGGISGLALAFVGIKLMSSFGTVLPRTGEINIDLWVLLFTFLVSVLSAIIFGILPAIQLSKSQPNETLKESGRNPGGGRRLRLLRILVVSEVALTLVLLIASGLMIKSLLNLQKTNPGFNANNVLTLNLALPKSRYAEPYQQVNFQQQLLQRVATMPGVESVASVNFLPFGDDQEISGFTIEGQPVPDQTGRPRAYFRTVTPDYFQVLNIPLANGRLFSTHDNLDSTKVVIVNQAAAQRYWSGEDPVNKRIRRGRTESSPWFTVVGVVGSANQTALTIPAQPEIYMPYFQNAVPTFSLALRTTSDPNGLIPSIQREVSSLDKDLPVSNIAVMSNLITNSIGQPRLYTFLLTAFTLLGVVLTALGVYGVLSYSITQRKHEIGVRMAMGARPQDILIMITREAIVLTLAGLGIGLLLSFALMRFLSSLLFDVSAKDPTVFFGFSLLMFGIALLSSYLPLRKSTRVDPLIILRSE